MQDSHLISPNIKEYCAKFNIENILNDAINEILTKYPRLHSKTRPRAASA